MITENTNRKIRNGLLVLAYATQVQNYPQNILFLKFKYYLFEKSYHNYYPNHHRLMLKNRKIFNLGGQRSHTWWFLLWHPSMQGDFRKSVWSVSLSLFIWPMSCNDDWTSYNVWAFELLSALLKTVATYNLNVFCKAIVLSPPCPHQEVLAVL